MIKHYLIMEKEQEGFINLDFREADTKQFTHGIHTYPAMMIPQIARRLIYLYGKDAKTLLDPFMGSGTSLVEASLTNQIKEAYGFDLNPLAFLISKVKTTPLNIENLDKELSNIIKSKNYKELPKFKNIEFWFKPKVIEQLAIIKTAINKINDKDLIKHNPYVISEFERIALKNMKGMKEYVKARQKTKTIPQNYSSMEELPLSPESIDLIVTSPPYGDSKTTVAYGQFSRLALQWLDYEDVASLDNRLLGGKASKELEIKINSSTLKEIIKRIAEIDGKRAKEVLSFYEDFDKCVIQLDRVMTKNGFVCFVVGNRTVKGINIPTDKIMTEMFKARGNYKY